MPVTAGATNSTSGTYVAPPVQLMAATSRKNHGTSTFDIPLSLSTPATVECRTGGANRDHTLVFTFNTDVVSGSANVTSGARQRDEHDLQCQHDDRGVNRREQRANDSP
jgi:hypothetical protein